MENKKDKLASSFGSGSRKKKKTLPLNPEAIEQTAKSVHKEESGNTEVKTTSLQPKRRGRKKDYDGPVVKTSFDIPEDLYDALQEHIFKNRKSGLTMRAYLWDLIKKDLKWEKLNK